MKDHKSSRIALIIPQFGIFPDYVHYFIRSVSFASGMIDLIFITDQENTTDYGTENVIFKKMTLDQFNALASKKLQVHCAIRHGYKLCDLKPMYGLIFEDYLMGYEFWAHGDFDMVFGDVGGVLNKHRFDAYDIFCVQEMYVSGPFAVYRNIEKVNQFFMNSKSWQEILSYRDYVGFDEAGDVIRELWKGKNIRECNGKIESMTHLVKNEDLLKRLDVRVFMKQLINENFAEGTVLKFDHGKLETYPTGNEVSIYHFMNRKNLHVFNDLLFDKKIATFTFSDKGFYTGNAIEFYLGIGYSFIRRYWIRGIRKVKSKLKSAAGK